MGYCAAAVFIVLAGAESVDWSPTINTLLLIVLALITLFTEKQRRRDAREIKEEEQKISHLARDIHGRVTGSPRPDNLRTRQDDWDNV